MHIVTPTYATCPMSLYKARLELNRFFFPCWRATGCSFPAGVQQSLLPLPVFHKVFFPCRCFTGSSFPSGASQISYFKILPWQANKLTTDHKTYKLCRQTSNDHNCQICFTSLHVLWRKCSLTIFLLKVYGNFRCHATKQNGRSP